MVHPTRADKYYVESRDLDGQAYAAVGQLYQHSVAQDNTTKQSLNTIVFTATVLLSPLWSMSQLPTVAVNPILRIGTYAACISCVTAMVIGIILRVRLKFVTQSQATDTKGRPNKQTIMSASAVPLALLLSTIALFVFVLFGFTWDAGSPIPEDPADIRLSSDEQLLLVLFGTIAFVSTCSTTVASFVPAEHGQGIDDMDDIYEDHP